MTTLVNPPAESFPPARGPALITLSSAGVVEVADVGAVEALGSACGVGLTLSGFPAVGGAGI